MNGNRGWKGKAMRWCPSGTGFDSRLQQSCSIGSNTAFSVDKNYLKPEKDNSDFYVADVGNPDLRLLRAELIKVNHKRAADLLIIFKRAACSEKGGVQ
jgi:hypothetical protein